HPAAAERSFSVNLSKNIFRCFNSECAAQGNALDLWGAVHRRPLYEAALHLAATFGLPRKREDSHGGNWSNGVLPAMYGRSLARQSGGLFSCRYGSRRPPRGPPLSTYGPRLAILVDQGSDPTQPYPTWVVRQSATLLYGFAPRRKKRRGTALSVGRLGELRIP